MKRSHLVLMAVALLLIATSSYANVASGLVASYPFSGNAQDTSGNGNNATVNGASLTADRFGTPSSAYSFNGTSNYLRIADSASLNITGDLTISAWIRTSTPGQIIFSNMLEVSPHSGYSLRTLSDGRIQFISGDQHLFGTSPVTTGLWTHVAVTLAGTTATSYINGLIDNSGTVGVPTTSSVDQTIGASYTPFYFWNGALDEINVYNRALSPSEIQELAAVPEPSSIALTTIAALIALTSICKMRRRNSPLAIR